MTELHTPIYIVDDDPSIRDALGFMLDAAGCSVSSFASAQPFLEQCPLDKPGCLILDSRMPGISGPELHRTLLDAGSVLAVIFLTGHGDVPMAVNAFHDGACDFFQKPVDAKALLAALVRAQQHSLDRYRRCCYQSYYDDLPAREQAILRRVAQGLTNRQIADEIFISVRTVEVNRAKLMEHMGAQSMAELIRVAQQLGF